MTSMPSERAPAAVPPPPATSAQGAAQRQRLQTLLDNVRWWTIMGNTAGLVLFTVLAAHATASTTPTGSSTGGAAAQAAVPANAPSQSLFQGQGVSDDGGGFLSPSASLGAPVRSRTS